MTELLKRRARSLNELCLQLEALGLLENVGKDRFRRTELGHAISCPAADEFASEDVVFYFQFEVILDLLPEDCG